MSAALVAAQQTAQAAQALHAGTLKQRLADGEAEPEVHRQETDKKGWLRHLYGKNNVPTSSGHVHYVVNS